MDRARFLEELTRQRGYCEGRSALYAAVLRSLEADAAGSPAWLDAVADAWKDRPFAVGWEAPHLLLACMHLWALRGAAPELASVYPSCGGPGRGPGAAAKAFLRRAPAVFWAELRRSRLQTNEVGRSAAWMIAAAAFRSAGLPFHLVEMGASAGLNLIGDHLPSSCRFFSARGEPVEPPPHWEAVPHPVLTRTGLDLLPRLPSNPADRLWIKACVWADDLPRLKRLEEAIAAYLRLEKEAFGPRLERCSFSEVPGWLGTRRRPRPGESLLVFNAAATAFLAEKEYQDLRREMARVLARWGDRALWMEFERARGAVSGPHELVLHRVAGGRFKTRVLAATGPRPEEIRVLEGWDDLRL